MCGIVGYFDKNKTVTDGKTLLSQMANVIRHRGPDEQALYVQDNCGLGMRRLSIIDLTTGLYPFQTPDKQISVIFNGEIYNYLALQNELKSIGYSFKTHCDGEVILNGYRQWGTNVFAKLRGMFAIAIYDKSTDRLILARDRLGIKPLYYVNTSGLVAFGSEVKALLSLRNNDLLQTTIDFSIDSAKTQLLLGFMFLPDSESTIIKGIQKVEPATYLEITKTGIKKSTYWTLQKNPEIEKLEYLEALDILDEKLTKTIESHLMSDVPLAHLLSGGVDSSLIVSIIAKKLGRGVNTFTAKFDHPFDESGWARETASYLHTTHNEIVIDTKEITENIERLISNFDDLTTFDGGLITLAFLSKKIQEQGVKVVLLGEGADELFGGYSWFSLSQLPFSLFPGLIRNSLYYYAISRNITKNTLKYINYWAKKTNSVSTFNDISRTELQTQLPNHLLMKVDKGSMSSSIEARVPYLDHELVEYVYSLPTKYKLAKSVYNPYKSNGKRILRDLAARYLPKETAFRKKRGFFLPMNLVLTADTAKVKEYVLDPESVGGALLGSNFITNLFTVSNSKAINMQKEYFLWRLFILEVWAKAYKLSI